MNFVAKFKAVFGIFIISSVSGILIQPVGSQEVPNPGVPDFIYQADGQPVIATFFGRAESYALGCMRLRKLWGSVPTKPLNAASFRSVLDSYPIVADIPCNANVRAYAPKGEPGALVFKNRDGQLCRHYVDNLEWFTATRAGGEIEISAEQFRNDVPCRGSDFRVSR
jgi:hypothetical protein